MAQLTKFTEKLMEKCKTKDEFMEMVRLLSENIDNQFGFYKQEIEEKLNDIQDKLAENDNILEWGKAWDEYHKCEVKKEKQMVAFKSTPDNFAKENDFTKRNTVRLADDDKRFDYLDQFMEGIIDLDIKIICTTTGKIFIREVLDVTIFRGPSNTKYYIISW